MHLMIEKGNKWIPQIISELPRHFADVGLLGPHFATIAKFQWFWKAPSPLNGMVRGNHWVQWFFDGFGVRQPLVLMVYDGSPPSVQRWSGYIPSLKSNLRTFCVKFWLQKVWPSKIFDKYHVCPGKPPKPVYTDTKKPSQTHLTIKRLSSAPSSSSSACPTCYWVYHYLANNTYKWNAVLLLFKILSLSISRFETRTRFLLSKSQSSRRERDFCSLNLRVRDESEIFSFKVSRSSEKKWI